MNWAEKYILSRPDPEGRILIKNQLLINAMKRMKKKKEDPAGIQRRFKLNTARQLTDPKNPITYEEFYDSHFSVVRDIERTARMFAVLVDRDGKDAAYEKASSDHPAFSTRMLILYDKIGHGEAIPDSLHMSEKVATLLVELPLAQQAQVAKTMVPLAKATKENPNEFFEVTKPLAKLTEAEAKLAFAGGKLKTPEEQAQAIVANRKPEKPRYQADHEGIKILKGTYFAWGDLWHIMEKHWKTDLKSLEAKIKENQIKK